jgi:AraC-like DNA-binding protein
VTYRERRSTIAGATAWRRVADGREAWVLPDGCMDLIWDGTELFVAGPDTGPHRTAAPSGTTFAAVRFGPGTGPAALGVPADAVRDQRVPVTEVWDRDDVDRTLARLADQDPVAVIEDVAAQRLEATPPDPLVAEVARLAAEGLRVAEVADAVGLGDRQLRRRSLAAFGYGPKVLARILRLQRALAFAREGSPLSQAAAQAGYFDQAHLAREVRALAGASMAELATPDQPSPSDGSGAKRSTLFPSGSSSDA